MTIAKTRLNYAMERNSTEPKPTFARGLLR